VTRPVTAKDLSISFELLFQVIAANTARKYEKNIIYLNQIHK